MSTPFVFVLEFLEIKKKNIIKNMCPKKYKTLAGYKYQHVTWLLIAANTSKPFEGENTRIQSSSYFWLSALKIN